jgi:glutaryl-CoA dehydrogenase
VASNSPLKKAASSSKQLNPMDLFDVRAELSDEELMVQESVARFVDDKVLPIIRDAFEKHYFPRELIPQVAELGLLGSSIEGYDCAGFAQYSG